MIQVQGITHWSIPVNDLEESEKFYRDILGLEFKGRLGGGGMSCIMIGEQPVLLCQRNEPEVRTEAKDGSLHHSITVTPDSIQEACKLFTEKGVQIVDLVYREQGFFTGRELYFLDPSGNRLELRDPTWKPGMPKPSHEELARA